METRTKKIIYIDLDDVIADFAGATWCPIKNRIQQSKMHDANFFFDLKPTEGSKGAILDLERMGFDLWILSQPLAESYESYSDKARWVQLHFPQLYKKIVLTQDKSLHIGEYLIDDNISKWGNKFKGQFVHFKYGGYNGLPSDWVNTKTEWTKIVEFFSKESPNITL